MSVLRYSARFPAFLGGDRSVRASPWQRWERGGAPPRWCAVKGGRVRARARCGAVKSSAIALVLRSGRWLLFSRSPLVLEQSLSSLPPTRRRRAHAPASVRSMPSESSPPHALCVDRRLIDAVRANAPFLSRLAITSMAGTVSLYLLFWLVILTFCYRSYGAIM